MLRSKFWHKLACGHHTTILFTEYKNEMSCALCGVVVQNPERLREWPLDRKSGKPFPKVKDPVTP